jgi:PKD repeat protein
VVAVRAVSPTAGAGLAQTAAFQVSPPTARITSAPTGTLSSNEVQLSFTSDDPTATYDCRVDGGAWTTCASPFTVIVPNGTHTLSVRAVGASTGPARSPRRRPSTSSSPGRT